MSLKYCFSNGFVFGRWVVCGSLSKAEEHEETEREGIFQRRNAHVGALTLLGMTLLIFLSLTMCETETMHSSMT